MNPTSREQTRQRLLDAALAEFAERGFEAATTRAIAARADVNEVTLFRHFGTKLTLFEEVMDQHASQPAVASAFLQQVAELPLREMLLQVARTFYARHIARWKLVRLALLDEGDASAIFRVSGVRLRDYLTARLEKEQAAGRLQEDLDVAVAARSFIVGLFGIVVMAVMSGKPDDEDANLARPDQFIAQYVDIFLEGIQVRRG